MQLILIAHGAQNIKNRIPLLKRHRGGFEYLAACRDYPLPLFFKMHALCNGGIAPYRYGAGVRLRLFTSHGSRCLLSLYGFGSYFIIPCLCLRPANGCGILIVSAVNRRRCSKLVLRLRCGVLCGKAF